jgi:transcriptional regulator with XRE-family HTH domain
MPLMNVREVGSFIRSQRTNAKLSLRGLSSRVGVSIPYLSQVERGLRKPSADILQAIAKGLRISAETLYVKAGMLEDRPVPDVAAAIMADQSITERQKQALLQIHEAFRQETGRDVHEADRGSLLAEAPQEGAAQKPARAARGNAGGSTRTSRTARPRSGGKAKRSGAQSHGARLRPSSTHSPKEV